MFHHGHPCDGDKQLYSLKCDVQRFVILVRPSIRQPFLQIHLRSKTILKDSKEETVVVCFLKLHVVYALKHNNISPLAYRQTSKCIACLTAALSSTRERGRRTCATPVPERWCTPATRRACLRATADLSRGPAFGGRRISLDGRSIGPDAGRRWQAKGRQVVLGVDLRPTSP